MKGRESLMENDRYQKSKSELREKYLALRNKLNAKDEVEASRIISQRILSHPQFIKAKHVMLYIPFQKEVNIRPVIEEAWKERKNVLVSKTDIRTKRMEPYLVADWNDIERGNFDLYEPKTSAKTPFPLGKIELVLVPGIAFDLKGHRLGFGAGFYDRFFDRFNTLPFSLGIAYDFQLIDSLPTEQHDYSLTELITEKRMISVI